MGYPMTNFMFHVEQPLDAASTGAGRSIIPPTELAKGIIDRRCRAHGSGVPVPTVDEGRLVRGTHGHQERRRDSLSAITARLVRRPAQAANRETHLSAPVSRSPMGLLSARHQRAVEAPRWPRYSTRCPWGASRPIHVPRGTTARCGLDQRRTVNNSADGTGQRHCRLPVQTRTDQVCRYPRSMRDDSRAKHAHPLCA
jgi:hypothetical protein